MNILSSAERHSMAAALGVGVGLVAWMPIVSVGLAAAAGPACMRRKTPGAGSCCPAKRRGKFLASGNLFDK
jgi:hypothetical protein